MTPELLWQSDNRSGPVRTCVRELFILSLTLYNDSRAGDDGRREDAPSRIGSPRNLSSR